jgi:hypothetical protein
MAISRRERRKRADAWSMGCPLPVPMALSQFERKVKSLALTQGEWVKSVALRNWVQLHKNTKYVPEELLAAYDMSVQVVPEADPNSTTTCFSHEAYRMQRKYSNI